MIARDSKRCRTCLITKARECFSRDADRKDGLYYQCKTCKAEASKEAYRASRGAVKKRWPKAKQESSPRLKKADMQKWTENLHKLIERTRHYFRRPNLQEIAAR